jgi:hypothetical protein
MAGEEVKKLLERAKTDPVFFHQLVYEPDNALANLGYSSDAGTTSRSLDCGHTCPYTCESTGIWALSAQLGCRDVTCASSCGWTCYWTGP